MSRGREGPGDALGPPRMEETSHGIVDAARLLFGASAAILYRVEADRRGLSVLAAVDGSGRMEGPWPTLRLDEETLAHRAVHSGDIAWTVDATGDPPDARRGDPDTATTRFPARAMLAAPLLARGDVVGILVLHGEAPGIFGDEHVEPARAFAGHAASSLESARLADELVVMAEEHARRHREAERRHEAARSLAEVGQLISASLDPTEVARRIVDSVLGLLGAVCARLTRLDPATGDLVTLAITCGADRLWREDVVPAGQGISGLAIGEGRAIAVPDLMVDLRLAYPPVVRARLAESQNRAMLAVPLLAEGRVIGVLSLRDRTGRVFTPEEIELARTFADEAAVALENARLVDALTKSEARYRAIVDSQTDLICRTLLDGTLTFVNEAYGRCFGLGPAEAVGGSAYTHVVDEDREMVRRHRAALTPEHPAATLVTRMQASTGEVRWIQWTDQAIFDVAGQAVEIQSVGRDVTVQKQMEERLLESQKMDAVGELAAGIAHDFNNLLTIVMGGSHLLLSDLPPGNPHRSHAQAIARAADEAAELVRQLLAFGRRQPLLSESLEFDAVLTRMTPVIRRVVREDVELVIHPGAGGARVRGDAGQLEQVVLNLVLNACEAMPRGGQLEIATRLSSGRDRFVALAIRDTGVGMSPGVQGRAFEPFFTTKERVSGRGRGLGLSVVYGIVKQSGGEISIESTLDRGTTVTVELPCLDVKAQP